MTSKPLKFIPWQMQNLLILCNGLPPSKELLNKNLEWADYLIAADGGGNIARTHKVIPDIVIGDLDSFEPSEEEEFNVIHDPDQQTNDLEKALEISLEKQPQKVTVLGATGQRLDHTLKNLSVMKQYNRYFEELIFKDDFGHTKLLPQKYSAQIPLETAVSLFPLSGKVTGITTSGLKYPLQNESLENGIRDGSSNLVIANPVSINYKKGDLILFIAR